MDEAEGLSRDQGPSQWTLGRSVYSIYNRDSQRVHTLTHSAILHVLLNVHSAVCNVGNVARSAFGN